MHSNYHLKVSDYRSNEAIITKEIFEVFDFTFYDFIKFK